MLKTILFNFQLNTEKRIYTMNDHETFFNSLTSDL